MTLNNENFEFEEIIKEIVTNDTVKQMKKFPQHYETSCFDHCYDVSYISYRIAKRLHLDYRAAARAGMLHDLFLYDWHKPKPAPYTGKKHAFIHGKIACDNASKIFDLTEKEKDMITTHMFPVTLRPPRSKEGFLLTLVDKYCTSIEMGNHYIDNIQKFFRSFYGKINT